MSSRELLVQVRISDFKLTHDEPSKIIYNDGVNW